MEKKKIVISAVNLVSGGTLTILRDCLSYLSQSGLCERYDIYALVHSEELVRDCSSGITVMECPEAKRSWLKRCKAEYLDFKPLSQTLKPFLWLSLHDMTPRVEAERRAVYMHNPSPFQKLRLSDLKHDRAYVAFALLYKWIYRFGVKKNNWLIVQQVWLRDAISRLCGVSEEKIIVARPVSEVSSVCPNVKETVHENDKFVFFFPSLPRPFKNFETVCRAAAILEKNGMGNFEVWITVANGMSSYADWLQREFGELRSVKFIGLQSAEEMRKRYSECDCLIFPSRLETWGLPISEFIPYHKRMILADLPYAHETSQGAVEAAFFDPDSPLQLSQLMEEAIHGDNSGFGEVRQKDVSAPYAKNWEGLFEILLK